MSGPPLQCLTRLAHCVAELHLANRSICFKIQADSLGFAVLRCTAVLRGAGTRYDLKTNWHAVKIWGFSHSPKMRSIYLQEVETKYLVTQPVSDHGLKPSTGTSHLPSYRAFWQR